VGVLDRDHARRRHVSGVGAAHHALHLIRPEAARAAANRSRHHTRMDRRPAELGEQDVRILFRDQLVTRFGKSPEGDLVRHRRGRDEDRLLLAEQIGHPALELVDGRVLAPLLVSDERVRDRLAHAGARLRLGVGAKVDHASTLASVDM